MKSAVALGLLSQALSVSAHPHHARAHAHAHVSKRGVNLNDYMMSVPTPSNYSDSWSTGENPVVASAKTPKRSVNYIEASTELVKKIVPTAEFYVLNGSYVGTNGIGHVNFRQTANGLDIQNADFNVNVWPNGTIFSYGNSFYTGEIPTLSRRDASSPEAAVKGAISTLNLPIKSSKVVAQQSSNDTDLYTIKGTTGTQGDPEAKLVYIMNSNGTLSLTWRVETNVVENWLVSYVDAVTNTKIHSVVDYVSNFAQYNVYPWGVVNPDQGKRQIEVDPWTTASPVTWHGNGTGYSDTLAGNNAIAQSNPTGDRKEHLSKYRPHSADRNFNYEYSPSMTDPTKYIDASMTQLFYTVNKYHDLLYSLGFTEAAGNFQVDNFGKGGLGGDEVIIYAQDGSGFNNAAFATPGEGSKPTMYMFLWNRTLPMRDSAFDESIVIHEYTHGLTMRMTGGSFNSECLATYEAAGMNEGWSDFMASAIQVKKTDNYNSSFTMGSWISSNNNGPRRYSYSTDMSVNNYTYKSLDEPEIKFWPHTTGNVWATFLYDIMWDLIEKHGHPAGDVPVFDKRGAPTDGKYLAMKLVMDGMALQPCRPDFISARQAIIDADRALTGGANKCLLWKAFARRGLGSKAKYHILSRTESFDIPWFTCFGH